MKGSPRASDLPRVKCSLTFLPGHRGKRSWPPHGLAGGAYRPYLILEDVVAPIDGDLLSVAFVAGPVNPSPGRAVPAEFVCLHHPALDYSVLTPGTRFRVVEGGQMVADGKVLEGFESRKLGRSARA